MISLFLPVSMTTERYAARMRNCLGAFLFFLNSDTTIFGRFRIHSDNQTRDKNGHFQQLANFSGFFIPPESDFFCHFYSQAL